jgi:hypothetical protein
MDKEPSMLLIAVFGVLGGTVGLIACRRVPWLLVIAIPVGAWLPFCALSEFRDPFVGPAIVQEAGVDYGILSAAAVAVTVCGSLAGAWQGLRKRSNQSGQPTAGEHVGPNRQPLARLGCPLR